MKISNFKVVFFFMVVITSGSIIAQSIHLEQSPLNKTQISLDFSRSIFSNSSLSRPIYSGIYTLKVNTPVSSKFNIIGNLPFVINKYHDDSYFYNSTLNESGLGNISLGIQTNNEALEGRRTVLTLRFYLPTVEERIAYLGIINNYYDLLSYLEYSVGIYFNVMHEKINEQGFRYSIEAGPNLAIPTMEGFDKTELLLHFGGSLGYQINKLVINAEFKGICIITEDFNDFSDRFYNSASIGLQWNEENFTPKIFFQRYIKEDLSNYLDGVWGLGFSYRF